MIHVPGITQKGPIDNMKFILGTKGAMTTVFTEDGAARAATIINAAPSVVTQVKTMDKEGYSAVQIGFADAKPERINKAQVGHAHAAQSSTEEGKRKALKHFRETNLKGAAADVEVGATMDVSAFAAGEKVTVSAISKGKVLPAL